MSGYTIHLGSTAVYLGEIDQVLVLCARTTVNPLPAVSISGSGILSPTGSSKSFDAAADGYNHAEGSATVLLECLDLAQRNSDHIYFVVTGGVINANGKGKPLTMPEGEAQGRTISTAFT